MVRIVVLDSGPLGLLCNPKATPTSLRAREWMRSLSDSGAVLILPEIADYEVRRELIRGGRLGAVARLDALPETTIYAPVTTAILRRAADFWAEARRSGRPTADRHALDGDVILAAQALGLAQADVEVVVATTNPGHLAQLLAARPWHEIS